MCYGSQRLPPFHDDNNTRSPPLTDVNTEAVENLRLRLAETEARLQRAGAREAELSKKLVEMKRFVSLMEILECYLKRRFVDQQQQLAHLVVQSWVPK
ncbi:hypothetical protein HanRHA438_Chr02g0093941 [Helianthus annuus]|uniref:Protein SKIP34 n=1 Tax=Helianthus annuus TaxID=4232 RepID=A0A9K3JSL6_HELAN|nr:hypothetical protein HanXRQr2_Chr02g0082601 [Helianthus annuus]KAJ0605979.1 hypothetical protein HanHA300_Chr02g0069021 [Helianthus annuus]KAJ0619978.1 hypothetical protein HanHA89_Chr02g0077311 [Helianthus annuus]KAJ0778436.1 hypothetical protein HanLR1_Chr02g0071681 [Helianthus annuus]KAJ0787402.1 hypothetical protein HanOQP8_Chr02g0082091 [Helianthus annuus]